MYRQWAVVDKPFARQACGKIEEGVAKLPGALLGEVPGALHHFVGWVHLAKDLRELIRK